MNINWLLDRMSQFAGREAMVYKGQTITYNTLMERFADWRKSLLEMKIVPGEIVALEADYSPEACGALLALIANGNIIVPLLPNVFHRQEELMSIANVQVLLRLGAGASERYDRTVEHEMLRNLASSRTGALVLFSSGSTGVPKGIVHRLDKLLDRYRTERETLRTLSFLLFDHIGGFNTLLHTFSNGGTVICPAGRKPAEICAMVEQYRVELLPVTPSFLHMLLMTAAYRQFDMSSLRVITYGTEVMPEQTLTELSRRLPGIQFRQTYGLSELGILRAKSQSSDSLWVKVGGEGVETRVIEGILHIRSLHAMEGYLNAPDPFDNEGWFNTQDQVLQNGDFIRFLGRKSEIINVGGQKVFPAEVEGVLMQMPEIKDAIVKGRANPITGQVVSAVVNVHDPIEPKELKQLIRMYCKDKLASYQIPVYISIQNDSLISSRFKKIRR